MLGFLHSCRLCQTAFTGALCTRCRATNAHRFSAREPLVAHAWTLTAYESPVGEAIARCKRTHDRALALVLARLFAKRVAPLLLGLDGLTLVPAPTSWSRQLQRGFHLPAMQAHALAKELGVPWCSALSLKRGPQQAHMSTDARRTNLRGRLRGTHAIPNTVLVIDDVFTTGNTANACARELLGDETKRVHIATLCAKRDAAASFA